MELHDKNNQISDIIKEKVILDAPLQIEGTNSFIPIHTIVTPKKIIAGNNSATALRIKDQLVEMYGGNSGDWQKVVGVVESDAYLFDIHWYRDSRIGKNKGFKIKSKKRKE